MLSGGDPPPDDAPVLDRAFHAAKLATAVHNVKVAWEKRQRRDVKLAGLAASEADPPVDVQAGLRALYEGRKTGEVEAQQPWWQRAREWVQDKVVQPVQQAAPRIQSRIDQGLRWIDQNQPLSALAVGVGVGLAAAAIVLTGGLAAPIAMGLAVGVAGLTVGAGTVGLNAYLGHSLGANVLRNAGYAVGAAVLTSGAVIGAGLLVQHGVVQQGLYAAGNAATRLCVTHPVGCARVGAALELWDKVEDLGLQAKLALQTARGDPRAAETALELQLEQLDNTPGNTTFREIQESLETLVGRYGDDVTRLVERFGMEGAELLAKHEDDGVEFLSRHLDEAEDVSRYVSSVVEVDLANLDLEQGYVVSRTAQELDVPITITGRWADTPEEATLRRQAADEWKNLVSQGIDPDLAKIQIGRKYGLDPHQVKVSSGAPEVDVFIPKNIWDNLSPEQQDLIRQRLEVFNVEHRSDFRVDFYQNILPDPDLISLDWPDPRTNVPPGSITFNPNGTVTHEPFVAP